MEMFKKYNYFTSKRNSGQYICLKTIVSFIEDLGGNFLCLLNHKEYYKSPFRGGDTYNMEFSDIEVFSDIIENKSNLFRIDNILLDFSGMSSDEVKDHMDLLKPIGSKYTFFIMCDDVNNIRTDDQTLTYSIETSLSNDGSNQMVKSAYMLTNTSTKLAFELTNLFKQYKRSLIIDRVIKGK